MARCLDLGIPKGCLLALQLGRAWSAALVRPCKMPCKPASPRLPGKLPWKKHKAFQGPHANNGSCQLLHSCTHSVANISWRRNARLVTSFSEHLARVAWTSRIYVTAGATLTAPNSHSRHGKGDATSQPSVHRPHPTLTTNPATKNRPQHPRE